MTETPTGTPLLVPTFLVRTGAGPTQDGHSSGQGEYPFGGKGGRRSQVEENGC